MIALLVFIIDLCNSLRWIDHLCYKFCFSSWPSFAIESTGWFLHHLEPLLEAHCIIHQSDSMSLIMVRCDVMVWNQGNRWGKSNKTCSTTFFFAKRYSSEVQTSCARTGLNDYVCYFTWQIFELDFVTDACPILDLLILDTANVISLFYWYACPFLDLLILDMFTIMTTDNHINVAATGMWSDSRFFILEHAHGRSMLLFQKWPINIIYLP